MNAMIRLVPLIDSIVRSNGLIGVSGLNKPTYLDPLRYESGTFIVSLYTRR